jgi:drug/metabolite transporter (DMT)-like permease
VNAVALALGASLSWGLADFFGPLKGRTLGTFRVLFGAQVAGLAAMVLVVAVRGKGPDGAAVLLAIPAALSGTLGIFAYYRGMAVGAMSVVAPIAGVSAAVPVAFGLATGDRPSTAQIAGIVLALVGVGLASREHQAGHGRVAAGVGLALIAAIGFGGYFVPMHAAGEADFWWASLIFRATAFTLIAVTALVVRASVRVSGRNAAFVGAVGLGDTLGNALFAASSRTGSSASRRCWRRSIRSSRWFSRESSCTSESTAARRQASSPRSRASCSSRRAESDALYAGAQSFLTTSFLARPPARAVSMLFAEL